MKILNQIIFSAEIDESLANAIRRYVHEIPVLAIDEVEIIKNGSPLYDETIAHRLGLIPLKTDKSIDNKKTPKLKLISKNEGVVYSGEIKGPVKIVYNNIPVTLLNKGQEIEIIATTKLGKGSEHSKFVPGLMFYRNKVDIKINKDCPKDIIEACPLDILKTDDGKIVAENIEKCDMCEACVDVAKKQGKPDSIKITPTNELIITLESFGQLESKEIFLKAIENLKKDLSETKKRILK